MLIDRLTGQGGAAPHVDWRATSWATLLVMVAVPIGQVASGRSEDKLLHLRSCTPWL